MSIKTGLSNTLSVVSLIAVSIINWTATTKAQKQKKRNILIYFGALVYWIYVHFLKPMSFPFFFQFLLSMIFMWQTIWLVISFYTKNTYTLDAPTSVRLISAIIHLLHMPYRIWMWPTKLSMSFESLKHLRTHHRIISVQTKSKTNAFRRSVIVHMMYARMHVRLCTLHSGKQDQ